MTDQDLEQARAALRDIAPLIRKYFQDLVDQGFTNGQAMHLTTAFQTSLMLGNREEPKK